MKSDIILAGVGGQGIISIAAAIGGAALHENLHMKQAEVHGMSQRGGAVQSTLRVSSKPIASDLIAYGSADMIVSLEPMESLRYLSYLKPDGWVITNAVPFVNITDYPELEDVYAEIKKRSNHVIIDAEEIAGQVATKRAANMVMLGAASNFIDIPLESIKEGIRQIFGRKGEEITNSNIDAMLAGREAAQKFL
ncbi:MAG: indolepyruvate oxidoreductase subunit beta [Bacteroidales bacterium]|nr:indolepyruvate oxidoreductase subunit beta [Bacteroidales bacterium]